MPHHHRRDVRLIRSIHHLENRVEMTDRMPDRKRAFEILSLHVNDQEGSVYLKTRLFEERGEGVPTMDQVRKVKRRSPSRATENLRCP